MMAAWAVRIGCVAVAALALLLYQSIFWLPALSLPVKLIFAAYLALALTRPPQALLMTGGLAPVALALWPLLDVDPARGTEALVLGFLAGWFLRRRSGAWRDAALATTTLLFGLTALMAGLVALTPRIVLWSGPVDVTEAMTAFFATQYLDRDGFDVVHASLWLVEGAALVYAVSALTRMDGRLGGSLVRMTLAGASGAACLSLVRVTGALLRAAEPGDILGRLARGAVRLSNHVPDVNAAGSYFVMALLIALGVAAGARKASMQWLAVASLLGVALLLSGSRAALAAGLFVLLVGSWLLVRPLESRRVRRFGVAGLVLGGVALVALVEMFPERMIGRRIESAVRIRYQFMRTSARMISAAPVFGVGINQYRQRSNEFMPPFLRRVYGRENAHNYFLQMAAELGLIGGVLFLAMVLVPMSRAWHVVRRARGDPEFYGVVAGVAAFLATCLSGHPLLHLQVAVPFWIVIGMMSGSSMQASESVQVPAVAPPRRSRALPFALATATAVFLVASGPHRVSQTAEALDLSQVTRGFYDWETNHRNERFRWTRESATFYVRSGVRFVEIPVRSYRADPSNPVEVVVQVNGRIANRVSLVFNDWTSIKLTLPEAAESGAFWRIDLHVSPVFVPAEIEQSSDWRVLGIRVGEIKSTPQPENRATR